MQQIVIGVDPHKLSATVEVVDHQEKLLGSGRFTTDQAGYAAMRKYANSWPDRVWAVEGANGVGRPLAQRLLEAGDSCGNDLISCPVVVVHRQVGYGTISTAVSTSSSAPLTVPHSVKIGRAGEGSCRSGRSERRAPVAGFARHRRAARAASPGSGP